MATGVWGSTPRGITAGLSFARRGDTGCGGSWSPPELDNADSEAVWSSIPPCAPNSDYEIVRGYIDAQVYWRARVLEEDEIALQLSLGLSAGLLVGCHRRYGSRRDEDAVFSQGRWGRGPDHRTWRGCARNRNARPDRGRSRGLRPVRWRPDRSGLGSEIPHEFLPRRASLPAAVTAISSPSGGPRSGLLSFGALVHPETGNRLMLKCFALARVALAFPLAAQNQQTQDPADGEWLWHERAIVEGVLVGAFVGSLIGVSQCSGGKLPRPASCTRGRFLRRATRTEMRKRREHIKTSAKAAGIGPLIGDARDGPVACRPESRYRGTRGRTAGRAGVVSVGRIRRRVPCPSLVANKRQTSSGPWLSGCGPAARAVALCSTVASQKEIAG